MKPPDTRALAAHCIARVLGGASLDDVLAHPDVARVTDAPFLKALVYGVLRDASLLGWLVGRLLDRPLGDDPNMQALLMAGIHQMRSMSVAPHAAVSQTVEAVQGLKRAKASGLVNAVLRRYQREQSALEDQVPADPALRYSYPPWMVEALRRDWPRAWEAILRGGNEQGPLVLRVNRRVMTRDAYLQRLAEMNIGARAVEHCDDAVLLEQARPVDRIPGFNAGQVSVQDGAAQLAVQLLGATGEERVLDACAAPGGKTAHLLERAPELELIAVDLDPKRLIRVDENLRRLDLKATLLAGDATDPSRWWLGKPFEKILCDAPCSGTGVIRRHPDIKWLRRDTDIAQMTATQLKLLRSLWKLLRPGGTLLYATCSVLAAEGDEVIKRFSMLSGDVRDEPIEASWGEATVYGRRIAPGGAFDGFYYAKLVKKP
jgi:16S rRNA (cytosine967-C5)-methyltransferase